MQFLTTMYMGTSLGLHSGPLTLSDIIYISVTLIACMGISYVYISIFENDKCHRCKTFRLMKMALKELELLLYKNIMGKYK